MGTVRERFLKDLVAKGKTLVKASMLLPELGNLRWSENESAYPDDFYASRIAELTANDTDPLPPIETVVKSKRGARRGE